MKAVDHCFTGYSPQMATDVGRWYLLLMNEEGEEFKLHGSLICNSQCSQTKLSVLIRSVLDMTDLFAFDGYTVKDYVQRLCIDYHRITKIKPKTTDNEATNCFTWDYSEQLVINRASSTLEHVQHIGSNCQVSRKLYVQGGVENLLDGIKEGFFEDIKGEPVDAITDPNDQNHYRLTVDFHKAPQKVIIGSYGKDGLPVNWPSLMVEIYFFIRFYGMGEILNPSVYSKAKRRIGERIFLHTVFREYGKSYCYLTDDSSIAVGDHVLVPVGSQGKMSYVKVKSIEYLPEDKAPIPFEMIKPIIRKCTMEDWENLD